jgi:hypothetical protein
MTNDALNVFYQGLLGEDGSMVGDGDDLIDNDGVVDDDKLEEYTARQEAANERKRNVLVSVMNIVELEDQEQRELDTVDLRRHRERFCGHQREKRRKGKRQWYCDPITGRMRRVCLQLSSWWLDYIQNAEPNCPSWNKVFR